MRRMVVDPSSSGQERSVLLLHPHWKVLLGPVVFGVLVVVAAIMVVVIIPAARAARHSPGRPPGARGAAIDSGASKRHDGARSTIKA